MRGGLGWRLFVNPTSRRDVGHPADPSHAAALSAGDTPSVSGESTANTSYPRLLSSRRTSDLVVPSGIAVNHPLSITFFGSRIPIGVISSRSSSASQLITVPHGVESERSLKRQLALEPLKVSDTSMRAHIRSMLAYSMNFDILCASSLNTAASKFLRRRPDRYSTSSS